MDTNLDGGPELGVEQPAQTAVVATEQLAQRLTGLPLVRDYSGGCHSTADLVVRGIDGGHHHLVRGGSGGRRISGRLVDSVAHDVRDVPECFTGIRKSLRYRESRRKIKVVIFNNRLYRNMILTITDPDNCYYYFFLEVGSKGLI